MNDQQSPGQGAGESRASDVAPAKRRIPKSTLPQLQSDTGPGRPPAGKTEAGERREFFNEAMRETLGPLAGMLERKINPILAALEAIPEEAERLAGKANAGSILGPLDQPQNGGGGGKIGRAHV